MYSDDSEMPDSLVNFFAVIFLACFAACAFVGFDVAQRRADAAVGGAP